jgi:hypothetical protein
MEVLNLDEDNICGKRENRNEDIDDTKKNKLTVETQLDEIIDESDDDETGCESGDERSSVSSDGEDASEPWPTSRNQDIISEMRQLSYNFLCGVYLLQGLKDDEFKETLEEFKDDMYENIKKFFDFINKDGYQKTVLKAIKSEKEDVLTIINTLKDTEKKAVLEIYNKAASA